jgi:hypothetical protein
MKVLFFPPNTTSKVQPLDQGIIRSFKAHYRKRLVKHVISNCASAPSPEQVVVSALDAAYWIGGAWKEVNESTIRNTFRTAGFDRKAQETNEHGEVEEENNSIMKHSQTNKDDIDPVQMLDALLIHVQIGGQRLSAAEFVDLDDETPSFNECEDGIENLLTIDNANNHDIDEEEDNQEEEPPKLPEALDMVRKLHLLGSSQHPDLHQLVSELDVKLTDIYLDSRVAKQSSITDFFQKS